MESRLQDLQVIARRQLHVFTRRQAETVGYKASTITDIVKRGEWLRLQAGVFMFGPGPPTWPQRLIGACMGAKEAGVASHRSAWMLWKLDGMTTAMVEITVAHAKGPKLVGVVQHRTRRWHDDERTVVDSIPVTSIERTLVDGGRFLSEGVVEEGMECAIRRGLTTHERLAAFVERASALPGATVLRRVLELRPPGGPAGSAAEVRLLRLLRAAGVPTPHRQHLVTAPDGRRFRLDLAWPAQRVGLEWDGIDEHAGSRREVADFDRNAVLRSMGWRVEHLRGSVARLRAEAIVSMVERLLAESDPAA